MERICCRTAKTSCRGRISASDSESDGPVKIGKKENTGKEIIEKFGSVIRENYAHVLNAQIVKILIDNLKIAYPAQIENVIPEKISYSLLLEVLRYFVSRGNTMIHLIKLIEFMERELRKCSGLTAEELAESAEKWLVDTIYKENL